MAISPQTNNGEPPALPEIPCIEQNMQMLYIVIEEGPGRMLQTLHRIRHIAPMHASGVGKLHLLNSQRPQPQGFQGNGLGSIGYALCAISNTLNQAHRGHKKELS